MSTARFNLNTKGNAYAATLGVIYNAAPKPVLAALVVSLLMRIDPDGSQRDLQNAVLAEWATLHENGIVPQKAPGQKSPNEW